MTYLHNLGPPSNIDGLPAFESTSNLTEMPNLSAFDVDEQMPQTIESRYFTIPELASLSSPYQDLSILHTNIRSLSLHHEELVSLTDLSKKCFNVIEFKANQLYLLSLGPREKLNKPEITYFMDSSSKLKFLSFAKSYLLVEGSPDKKLSHPYNLVLIYGPFK